MPLRLTAAAFGLVALPVLVIVRNDSRQAVSLENLREGVRCHTEMLLDVAAA